MSNEIETTKAKAEKPVKVKRNLIYSVPETVLPKSRQKDYVPDRGLKSSRGLPDNVVPFGNDNLLPYHLQYLNRKSPLHSGILKSKISFAKGAKLTLSSDNDLTEIIKSINPNETLYDIYKKIVIDYFSGGNAYVEVVKIDGKFHLFHHDWTMVRVSVNQESFIIKQDWRLKKNGKSFISDETIELPKFPNFEKDSKGVERSMYHFKEYEAEFRFYGVPAFVAGIDDIETNIGIRVWNKNRVSNDFKTSGILTVSGDFASQEDADNFKENIKSQHAGSKNAGELLVLVHDGTGLTVNFDQMTDTTDSDWQNLNNEIRGELLLAHSWYASLCGVQTNNGFDTKRILNDWNVAMSQVIIPTQSFIISKLTAIIGFVLGKELKENEISVVNLPPVAEPSIFMKVWEARKLAGLEYDPKDEQQDKYIYELPKRSDLL